MSDLRSPFRRVVAVGAIGLFAAAALAAGVSSASAAPAAPTITSPITDFATVSTTVPVSGTLDNFTDQDVTVRARLDGAVVATCVESVPYFQDTFSCDLTVPGPGKYEITATTVDLWEVDPAEATSGPSNAVTVVVGSTTQVEFTNYIDFSNVWTTQSPTLAGIGPALGSVLIEMAYNPGDGSGEQTVTYCTISEVAASGDWSCSGPPRPSWGYTYFIAYGTDVTGAPTAAGYDDEIGGDIVPPPPTTTLTLGPASISINAQGAADTWLQTELYDVQVFEGDEYVYGSPVATCDADGDPPALTCSFTGLAPGIWNVYTTQDLGESLVSSADDYVLIPSTPAAFTASVNPDRTVTFSGTGTPGYTVSVLGSGSNTVCAVTLGGGTNWQCSATLPVGTAQYRAVQQSAGFVATPPDDFGVLGSYNGISATTTSLSVTVPPAPAVVPPAPIVTTPTPLPWVLEGYDGGPLTPGQELTLSAQGLPPGTVIAVEIRSTPRLLGTTVVGDTGSFLLPVTVPTDLEPGQHTLVAIATPPGGVESIVSFPVTVVAATEPVSGDDAVEDSEAGAEPVTPISDGSVRGDDSRADFASPSAISDSIPTIDRIFRTPLLLLASGGLALAILLLVALPSELLNSTLASNTRRIGRWYSTIESGVERATEWFASVTRTRAIAAAILVVLTSLIFGFVDPNYGFDPVSVRMTISLAIGLFVVTYVASWISGAIIDRVWNIETRVSLQPAALVFAVVGVIVARLLDFSPGFLIGLVIGLDLITRVGAPHRVRAILTNISVMVGLAVLAWVGFSVMSALSSGEPGAFELLVSDALIATTAEGLTAAVAALLPLGFLDGHEVFRRSKALWAGSFAIVATLFALIVMPTAAGEDLEIADIGFWMLVMAIFAAVTLTLWAVLHFTGGSTADDDADEPLEVASR